MQCPQCGSDCYDNRADKAAGKKGKKWPDFKCKDRDCGWVKWPEKGKEAAAAPAANRPAPTMEQVFGDYARCVAEAEKAARWLRAIKAPDGKMASPGPYQPTAADVFAAAATLFIQIERVGAKPKPKRLPPPPPPEEEFEGHTEDDAREDAARDAAEDEPLPF